MFSPISSIHNPRIKHAVRLRDRKGRDSQGRMLVEGQREISRALAAEIEFDELFLAEGQHRDVATSELINEFVLRRVAIFSVAPSVHAKLSFGERESPLVATARTPQRNLQDFQPAAGGLIAVLAGLEKPGNLGAILRSADGAGVSAVIVADGATDLYNPNSIRASIGTIFALPTFSATAADTLAWLRRQQLPIYSTRVNAARKYYEACWRQSAAIVLGSEAHGLDSAWQESDVNPLAIPMCGVADSLNVSSAAAVIFYEALRQRTSIVAAQR